jgi:hypothetical protein
MVSTEISLRPKSRAWVLARNVTNIMGAKHLGTKMTPQSDMFGEYLF